MRLVLPLAAVAVTTIPVAALSQQGWREVGASGVAWTAKPGDNENNTTWNPRPHWLEAPDGTRRAIGLASMEGVEEPHVRWIVANKGVVDDDFVNITDQGGGVVRFFLRYRGNDPAGGWWDGDQHTDRFDRQRAEVKGIGPHQKDGQTYEYGTTFRTDPAFKGHERFCHVMQIKATDGEKSPPLVTMSLRPNGVGVLQYMSGNDGFRTAATFKWKPDSWQKVRFRLTVSKDKGALSLSVDGGPFTGVSDVPMYRPASTDYRPKWGLYRGTVPALTDDWVEHRDMEVRPL